MGIYEAVDLILRATVIGKRGDIIALDMGEQIPVAELAHLMIKLSGRNLKVRFTKQGRGEKFLERLMTAEEEKRAIKKDGLFIVRPKTLFSKSDIRLV